MLLQLITYHNQPNLFFTFLGISYHFNCSQYFIAIKIKSHIETNLVVNRIGDEQNHKIISKILDHNLIKCCTQ